MAKEKKETPTTDSAEVMFEIPHTLEIDGKTYEFAPLKLRQLIEFVKIVNDIGTNPLYALLDDEKRAQLIRALEICFAPKHPDMRGEALLDMLDADSAARVLDLVIRLSGPKKA